LRGRRLCENTKMADGGMANASFTVPSCYVDLSPVAVGAFGLVAKAKVVPGSIRPNNAFFARLSTDQVAIKRIASSMAFKDCYHAKQVYREISLLKQLTHENIIKLVDLFCSPQGDMYIITEAMDCDLGRILSGDPGTFELLAAHVKWIMYQLLRGLRYLHSGGVLHRDLKPNNLLVNKNCDLKICDFGLARGVDDSKTQQLTEYVVTRWYRAPELLVENDTYDEGIDIWSVGCILAEFLGRKAIFPGRDYLQQLRLIIETLGPPSASDLSVIQNPQAVEYIKRLPNRAAVPFSTIYPNASAPAVDLLSKMLVFDPRKRISAAKALEHEYLLALHNVNDEPSAAPFDFKFEADDVTENQLRELIWEQLARFHTNIGPMPSSFGV